MEMILRPMTGPEHFYCYAQSQQISMQTGLIGHLQEDVNSKGKAFFSHFFDFRASLKSPDFQHDLQEVVDSLRADNGELGFLNSTTTIAAYYRNHPECHLEDGRHFGLRADTPHYSYMLRVDPRKGEYNLYCYVRQWLERHMRQAERGIRFITPNYEEKFRIADGDMIRIIRSDGEKNERICRYIDETHFQIGNIDNGLFHICEFAEKMEATKAQEVIPLRASLPDKCFSYLESTGEMIVITKGEKGYTPTGIYPQDTSSKEGVAAVNEANGVTRAQEAAMVAGSMFGWHVPNADPKNYDEEGQPIRPKARERDDCR